VLGQAIGPVGVAAEFEMLFADEPVAGDRFRLDAPGVQQRRDVAEQGLHRHPRVGGETGVAVGEFRFQTRFTAAAIAHRALPKLDDRKVMRLASARAALARNKPGR